MVKKDVIKNELKRIEERHGILRPVVVVDEARNENHPLHTLFDWDDSSAGEKYRIDQARHLIRSVFVEMVGVDSPQFFNAVVQIEDVPTQGYFSIERVLSDEDLYKSALKEMIVDIRGVQRRYKTITELKQVINEEQLEALAEKVT